MMNFDSNIKELRNNLSLDFSLGPSQSKVSNFKTCVLETPEFARVALADTLGPHSKKMRYNTECMLATPDMAKIALSTPELDKLAMKTDFGLPTPSLNTFLRTDEEEDDKNKLAQNWANATKLQNIKTEEVDEIKFLPTSRNIESDKIDVVELNISQNGMEPIDMDDQERIKLERKRYRNRIAASKCRQRKLERISKLQERVDRYKNKNKELNRLACVVANICNRLSGHIRSHRERGCDIREL